METSEPKWVNLDDIQYGVNSLRLHLIVSLKQKFYIQRNLNPFCQQLSDKPNIKNVEILLHYISEQLKIIITYDAV